MLKDSLHGMSEAKHRVDKWLAQGYIASMWWGQASNPNSWVQSQCSLEEQTTRYYPEVHLSESNFVFNALLYQFWGWFLWKTKAFILTFDCLDNPTRPIWYVPILPFHCPIVKICQFRSSVFKLLTFVCWFWLAKPGLITCCQRHVIVPR